MYDLYVPGAPFVPFVRSGIRLVIPSERTVPNERTIIGLQRPKVVRLF